MGEGEQKGFFGGLLWYLEARNWAFGKIEPCPHGSHPFDIQMHHAIYFVNLLSAIDHVCHSLHSDKLAQGAFERDVEQSVGEATYKYVRELRNAIVHRGFDPTTAGLAHGARLCVLCPVTVHGRQDRGRRESYARPSNFRFTAELGAHCNAATNTAIAGVFERLDLFNPTQHMIGEDQVYAFIASSVLTHHWAREAAERSLQENYTAWAAQLAAARISRMRTLLGRE